VTVTVYIHRPVPEVTEWIICGVFFVSVKVKVPAFAGSVKPRKDRAPITRIGIAARPILGNTERAVEDDENFFMFFSFRQAAYGFAERQLSDPGQSL